MILVGNCVTQVISESYRRQGKWRVIVMYNSHGRNGYIDLTFDTKEEATDVCVGYEFYIQNSRK